MPAGGLLIGTAIGGVEALYGASQKSQYQKQLDALSQNRPQYQINPEEQNIVSTAQARAQQGMSAGAQQALTNNTDRNLATLSSAAMRGGADANSLGAIADRTQQATNQNAIYDDQQRMANLNNLYSAWSRMSANKDKQWQIDTEQPWKDKMTALSQQLAGANQMEQSGINSAGSALIGGAKGMFGTSAGTVKQPAYPGGTAPNAGQAPDLNNPYMAYGLGQGTF